MVVHNRDEEQNAEEGAPKKGCAFVRNGPPKQGTRYRQQEWRQHPGGVIAASRNHLT